MNRINSFVLLVFVSFFYAGCVNPSRAKILLKSYDHYGNLLTEQELTKDSVKDGFYKEYYSNGIVKLLCFYKAGKKDSVEILYDSIGKMEFKYFNKNGRLNGPYSKFYTNGNIEYTLNFTEGIKSGPSSSYFPNGPVKDYYDYDNEGNLRYKAQYKFNGEKEWEDGHAIIDVVSNKASSGLLIGDTFITNLIIAIPPHEKRTLFVHSSQTDSSEALVEAVNLYQSRSYLFKHYCNKEGRIIYRLVFQMQDSISNNIDTSYAVVLKLTIGKMRP